MADDFTPEERELAMRGQKPAPNIGVPIQTAPQPVAPSQQDIAQPQQQLPSSVTSPSQPLPSTAGIPNIARDNKMIPGTIHQDQGTGRLAPTPYSYGERINPMLGAFAHAENIHNPALRVLSRIASGIASPLMAAVNSQAPEVMKQRAAGIKAEDEEGVQRQEAQERGLKMKADEQKLGAESLLHDAQGNVVGYSQGGKMLSMENAPDNIRQLAEASKPKGGWSIKDINVVGPDGKPQAMSVMLNESDFAKVAGTPEFQQAPDKMQFLADKGVLTKMNMGQAVPTGTAAKPQYKMVPDPANPGMEQLHRFSPSDPTEGVPIGGKQRIGTTQLVNYANPNDPNDVQQFQRDNKTGALTHVTGGPGAGMLPAAEAKAQEGRVKDFNKDWETPAQQVERSYQLFQEAQNSFKNGNVKTGAASMLELSQHLGTTFGQIKGSRMNKDLIQEHKDAIGIADRIERFGNKLATGQELSVSQRKEFGELIGNMRNLTFQISAFEATRRHVPLDFLPADAQIKMKDSKGREKTVTGDRVSDLAAKGFKVSQ